MRRGLILLALVMACDDKKGPPPAEGRTPAPSASKELAALEADAGIFGEIDPPAPAGDLKAELDRFVNIDTCVAERAKLDPLVGDALGAIGYETFLRDACRLLEAAKDKKRETCDRIDASPLRAKCQSWVAMVAQTPDACPLQFENVPTRGRVPSCVAIAAKDLRLCNAEPRAVPRSTCEALVLRDPAKCDALLPSQRPSCQREVTRWRTALVAPLEGLEKLPAAKGKLTVRGVSGTADPPTSEVDLTNDFARGVVVVTSGSSLPSMMRRRVELGAMVESELAHIAATPQKRPRVALALLLEPGKDTPRPVLQKLELELPGEAALVSPPVQCDCRVTTSRVAGQRGGEAAIALEGTLSGNGRTYKIAVDVVTFVRDIVSESASGGPGMRVLPPIHPPLTSAPR